MSRDIKLLLNAGASLNACSKHYSAFLCATDKKITRWYIAGFDEVFVDLGEASLTEDMVKLLFDEDASVDVVNDIGLSPLELALKNCCYETEAIKLLFNLQIEVAKSERWKETVLYFALSNTDCKVSALKFLINNGARLDTVNSKGNSLMHVVLYTDFELDLQISIVCLLLKVGTPINFINAYRDTPLELAMRDTRNYSTILMLLAAGARVDRNILLESVHPYDNLWTDLRDNFKLLLKYALLQNLDFDFINKFRGQADYDAILDEVQRMESVKIGDGLSFREFLNELYLPREIEGDPNLDITFGYFNQLLKIMKYDYFPLFIIDVIVPKIGRELMEMKMRDLQVYATKFPESVQVVLNYYSLCNIAKLLSDEDLLRLILAFHIE